ncbi:MAG: DUF3422 family protein [Mesorhizobium sp.]|nr:MAG: DUF3422 family protein [Mesorhizobium sp.]
MFQTKYRLSRRRKGTGEQKGSAAAGEPLPHAADKRGLVPQNGGDGASGTGSVLGLRSHVGRVSALGEVHARPYPLISTPRLLVQLSFMIEGGAAVDQAVLADLARQQGVAAADRQARHFAMRWRQGSLRWERHTEFSTYLYEAPLEHDLRLEETPFGNGFNPPGTVISGVRVEIRKSSDKDEELLAGFDPSSLCYAVVEHGLAAVATDFRADGGGLTRILVFDRGLSPVRAGALSQCLIDIEAYRTLAVLGLPLALSLSGRVRHIEDRLAIITRQMKVAETRNSQSLLGELTELAAELEADAAASLYRFGASRAYEGIVRERLVALDEEPLAGYETWTGFLKRRLGPALRTCRSVEERQANLSRKLTRATTLLRTWVDVDVEKQNRDLLASMNNRARLQLQLQQTVEGLSVAAVAYYVVGLVGYLAKGGALLFGHRVEPEIVTAISVPIVVLLIWIGIRRIRHAHSEPTAPNAN